MDKYTKNITVLKHMAPQAAAWVESAEPDPRFSLAVSPGQRTELRVLTPSGQELQVYGAGDPMTSETARVGGLGLKAGGTTLLFGLGLGFLAAAIRRTGPAGHTVFVFEENAALIKLAFSQIDFTVHLADSTLVLVPPEEKVWNDLAAKIARRFKKGEVGLLVDENCRPYFSEDFKNRIERFRHSLLSEIGKESALIRYAADTVSNELANLPLTLLGPGLSGLKDALAGVPAVVLSAGPSLGAALPYLPEAMGRAAVIATAPVLRVLMAHDLAPDLVGVLDYTPGNQDVLRDAWQAEDTPMVFLEAVWPGVIRKYQGDLISVMHTDSTVRAWLGDFLSAREHWRVGGNVGSFCLDLAVYLGADPIIMVGQDLSFPGLATHSEGVVGQRRLRGDSPASDRVLLESVGGGRVLSNLTMAAYLEDIRMTVAEAGRTFINTSPNGARIAGTLEMPFPQALSTYAREERFTKSLLRLGPPGAGVNLDAVLNEMTGLQSELEALETVAAKTAEFSREITGRIADGEDPDQGNLGRLVQTFRQYNKSAEKYAGRFAPLRKHLTSTLARVDETGLKTGGSVETMLARSLVMMEGIKEGAQSLGGKLQTAREELATVLEMDTDSRHRNRDLARGWARLGRLKESWIHYRSALAESPGDPDLFLEAAEVARKRERLKTAREMLRLILAEHPDHREAAEALRLVEETAGAWLQQAQTALEEGDWVTGLLLARKVLAFSHENGPARQVERECLNIRRARLEQSRISVIEKDSGPAGIKTEEIIKTGASGISRIGQR